MGTDKRELRKIAAGCLVMLLGIGCALAAWAAVVWVVASVVKAVWNG